MNIDVSFVSGADPEEFKREIRANTKLIYLESPSSSLFLLQDIKKIAEIAKEKNIKTIIDNTWATPIFQKPLSMGIDIEVHSCSKYIGGHSDVVAGVVIGKTKDIDQIFLNEHALLGSRISAFESWLIMRSLRTLPIRMMKHQENAMKVAEFLEGHPRIKVVNYPGLKSYPQYDLAKEQMSGYSGLLSFIIDINNIALVKKFVNSLKLFKIGISWGGYESLVFAPVIALKEFTEEKLMSMGIDKAMVRISVGLENHIDLINDLDNALMKI